MVGCDRLEWIKVAASHRMLLATPWPSQDGRTTETNRQEDTNGCVTARKTNQSPPCHSIVRSGGVDDQTATLLNQPGGVLVPASA